MLKRVLRIQNQFIRRKSSTIIQGMWNSLQQITARKNWFVLVIILTYWLTSISNVFLNKYLLTGMKQNLDALCFLTWFQCVVVVLCMSFFGCIINFLPHTGFFEDVPINISLCIKTLPLSVVYVILIQFNSLCLKYSSVAFFHTATSWAPVWNVFLGYLWLDISISYMTVVCCLAITWGYLMLIDQETLTGKFSMDGIVDGYITSLCICINAILTKKYVSIFENNFWHLFFYKHFNAALLLIPMMILYNEEEQLLSYPLVTSLEFWSLSILSGMMVIIVGYFSSFQLRLTGPLLHNLSGLFKACLQTLIAFPLYGESRTWWWWMGYFLVLIASWFYVFSRESEIRTHDIQAQNEEKKYVTNVNI